jgi:3-dehydroquinate dehydratase-2
MKINIINGPNLNLLGKREKGIYGNSSFEEWLEKIRPRYPQIEIEYFQSNIEGGLSPIFRKLDLQQTGLCSMPGLTRIPPSPSGMLLLP